MIETKRKQLMEQKQKDEEFLKEQEEIARQIREIEIND